MSSSLSSVMLKPGYQLRQGAGLDRALLVKFMQRTYQELYPSASFAHLAQTVEQYFSAETPLWWVDRVDQACPDQQVNDQQVTPLPNPIGCVWLGMAIDQVTGWRHPHIFLLYVDPAFRRQGIGSALMQQVEAWARQRGDRQIGLQVFQQNQPARQLYEKLGYHTQSMWMVKSIGSAS
ncbi:MAG: GNAT family N-acetyltransferase [Elainella sp. Prado103]|nr:GNAT family N-acetyltransferase [Elainella sp. Prado103]